jgi:hypothetical protein
MWVRKNAHFGEPFEYDASGLVLESPDDAFRRAVIKNVLPGSPAADAGLAVDDEVIRIDGDLQCGERRRRHPRIEASRPACECLTSPRQCRAQYRDSVRDRI